VPELLQHRTCWSAILLPRMFTSPPPAGLLGTTGQKAQEKEIHHTPKEDQVAPPQYGPTLADRSGTPFPRETMSVIRQVDFLLGSRQSSDICRPSHSQLTEHTRESMASAMIFGLAPELLDYSVTHRALTFALASGKTGDEKPTCGTNPGR
jgi:hypothetical protein